MDRRGQERTGGATRLHAGNQARDFTLTGDDGQAASLLAELGKRPVVLSFPDGRQPNDADVRLATLADWATEIEAQGGTLLAISSAAWPSTGTPHALRVLRDAAGVVAGQYGISKPSTFVIDQAATIILSLIGTAPGSNLTCVNVAVVLSALRRARSVESVADIPVRNR